MLLPIVGNRTVCTRSPRASGRVVPQHPRRETTTGTLCRHSSVELRTYRYTALSAPVAFPTPFRWSTECSSVHRFPPQRLCTRRRIHIVKYKLHIPAGVTPRVQGKRFSSPPISRSFEAKTYQRRGCPLSLRRRNEPLVLRTRISRIILPIPNAPPRPEALPLVFCQHKATRFYTRTPLRDPGRRA